MLEQLLIVLIEGLSNKLMTQEKYLQKPKQLQILNDIVYFKPDSNFSCKTSIMQASYRLSHPNQFLSTPYKEVISQYVSPEHKPLEINLNKQVFPQKFSIHQNNATYQYKPKVIMSGYIVGEPVAFTETSNLPRQYPRFSPSKQHIQKPIFIQAPNGLSNITNLSNSVIRNQQSTIHREVHNQGDVLGRSRNRVLSSVPIGEPLLNTVRREDYDRLMNENILLRVENARLLEESKRFSSQVSSSDAKDRQIAQLQKQIHSLKQQLLRTSIPQGTNSSFVSNLSQSQRKDPALSHIKFQEVQQILSLCLSKYRDSILQQQKLLIDRFRLESKNQELDFKKQKLVESRKQQQQTHRRSSHYDKAQSRQSPTKQNWELPYRHSQSQRHWKK